MPATLTLRLLRARYAVPTVSDEDAAKVQSWRDAVAKARMQLEHQHTRCVHVRRVWRVAQALSPCGCGARASTLWYALVCGLVDCCSRIERHDWLLLLTTGGARRWCVVRGSVLNLELMHKFGAAQWRKHTEEVEGVVG